MKPLEVRLLEQHNKELEFRIRTLEKALLECGERIRRMDGRIVQLERFNQTGAEQFMKAIQGEEDLKQ